MVVPAVHVVKRKFRRGWVDKVTSVHLAVEIPNKQQGEVLEQSYWVQTVLEADSVSPLVEKRGWLCFATDPPSPRTGLCSPLQRSVGVSRGQWCS